MAWGVRVSGVRPNVTALKRFGASTQDMKGAFHEISLVGIRLVRSRTPVKTGRLLATTRGAAKANRASVIQGRKPWVGYAAYVNYGSVRNRARHQMQKADPQWLEYASRRLQRQLMKNRRTSGL